MHIIVQHKHLLFKRRIVGKNPCRIIPDMKSVCHGFHSDRFISICNDPVKLCAGKHFTEWSFYKIDIGKKCSGFFHCGTFSKDPGNKFKLGYVLFSFFHFVICCISHEIQPCHSKAFFIDPIIIKWIISCHMSHADNSIMTGKCSHMAKLKYIIPRCNGDLIAIGKFIVQCSSEIKIFCFVSCCCTHN